MASRWTSRQFWGLGGGGRGEQQENEEDEDHGRREKANSASRKQDEPENVECASREAAFVAAFEETDVEDRDHSTHLAVVPYESDSLDSPFEAFLSAVFSTLLALLLAWRFLAWYPESGGEQGQVGRCHDDSDGDERETRRQLTSSPDSSDSSSGHWRWFRSKPCSSASSGTSPCPESSANPNTRKQRKKRRPFDERLAPKRRVNFGSQTKNDDQLSPSLSEHEDASEIRPLLVHSLPLPPPPPSSIELEQQKPYSNESSCWRNIAIHHNAVVEWPTTAAEDREPDFVSRTISTPTMEPNFRSLHPEWVQDRNVEDKYGHDGPTIRMILGGHSVENDNSDYSRNVVSEKPATPPSPKTVNGGNHSARRPLVSPPPPPRDPVVSLATDTQFRSYIDMADEEPIEFAPSPDIRFHPGAGEEPLEDFLGSDLPAGFMSTVTDDISKSAGILLDDLTDTEALLSSRQAPDIIRDLDTITEVSETDDLTSLSSNGGAHFRDDDQSSARSKAHDSPRWSRSSTAPCTHSPQNGSEQYRLAPTVTACSSSSETVNDDAGEEVYVDGDPFLSTPTSSFHDAQTGFSLPRCDEKIDHASGSSSSSGNVIKPEHEREDENESEVGHRGKRTPCLPEENVKHQPQLERQPAVAWDTTTTTTTTTTENAFVTAPAGSLEAALAFAPSSPNVLRHAPGLAVLLTDTGNHQAETGTDEVVFREGNHQLSETSLCEKHQVLGKAEADNGEPELESFSTASSSGRTSVATDLPIDEPLPVEPCAVSRTIPAPEEDRLSEFSKANGHSSTVADPRQFSLCTANAEGALGDKTSSPNLTSNICKSKEDGAEVTSTLEESGGKNNNTRDDTKLRLDSDQRLVALIDDRSSSCSLSSWPRRERRFQLAYQQYHSQEREGVGESDFSHTSSSSCSSSEPTKTTLLKHESLQNESQLSRPLEGFEAAADEDDSTVPSSCMDQIDLEKALQRFARYGELYGDAPRSGMEEFGGNKNDADDSLDVSSLDSRMNSLPNGGSVGKMEALLKSTLNTKGSASLNGVGNGGLSSSKRDRVGDDLLSSNVVGGTAGAVHALASTRSNVNGAYTTTGTAKMTEHGHHQVHEGNGHGTYSVSGAGTRYGRATAAGGDDSNKTKATATSALLSHGEKVDDDEFLPPSRPRRLSVERGLHDKNRYSAQPSAALIANTNGASATTVAAANSNDDGICLTKFKSNPTTQPTRTVVQERELVDKRSRPTSAPLTPLLISSPTASSGLGLGYSSAFDQSSEPVCVASATSQAIINDPDSTGSQSAFFSSKSQRKILAEASANAVASNPYIALARATTAAASKVAEASNENLIDGGETGTVSLVVSSTVTTTKRDFFSTTKSTPDLLFFSSAADVFDVSGLEVKNQAGMSYRQQQRPMEVTPTYNVIPRGTASIFQQRHREMSPGRGSGIRSPERKRHNYGQQQTNGAESRARSTATTPVRETHEKKALFASSDHLQKLLEDPYYAKPPPKPEPPKRTPPKHEHHHHAPVATSPRQPSPQKTVPLIERNIIDWNNRPENSLQNQKQQNLLRWRNSMNLAENEELRQAMLEDEKRAKALAAMSSPRAPQRHDESMESNSYHTDSKFTSSVRATTPVAPELWEYKAFRDAQQRAQAEEDEETKRSRRNKYKAKIDRAKKEYLTTKASASDLYRSIEDFERKFNVSLENVRLPDPPRGPYLEYLSRSGHLHVLDVNDLPPPAYVRPKPRFDREYESIVKKAEESWAAYRRRVNAAAGKHGDDPYARSRAYSTGVLETDVDDISPYHRGQKSIVETDLDQVQREIEHESRKRTKATNGSAADATGTSRSVHSRAKSADYLMDQRARTEIEPPENQLQKILGDKDEKDLSEHELRFRKSTEKLQVPDWYLNSDYCPGGKAPSPDPHRSRASSRPTVYSTDRPERPKSTQSHYSYGRAGGEVTTTFTKSTTTPTTPKRQDDLSSRYVSPWVYGGRISGPQGMKSPESSRKQVESPPRSQRSATGKPYDSPKPLAKPTEILKQQPQPMRPEPRRPTELLKSPQQPGGTLISSVSSSSYAVSRSITETTMTVAAKQQHPQPQPQSQRQDFNLPKHFFDRYKDEIEELRKSRNNLQMPDIDDDATWEEQQLKRLSAQGVPVAAIRPNQVRDDDYDTTTSLSFSPASSPDSRPLSRPDQKHGHGHATPQQRTQSHHSSKPSPAPRGTAAPSGSFRDAPLNTSTPYSSDLLPRKHQPSKETAFEPYHHHQQQQQHHRQPQPERPLAHSEPRPTHPPVQIGRRPSFQEQPRHMPGGWTVSAVPADWNVPGQRDSVVIEVAGDALFDSGAGGNKGRRLPSHVTLDEILDSMLAVPVGGKGALTTINESSSSLLDDTQVLPSRPRTPTNLEGPGIYTKNQELMDKCLLEPELASELLKRETLWVKCGYCTRIRELDDARRRGYVSCHHCYTYYCNRICRRSDWDRHLDICSFARINTLCKQVILKVRQDTESQFQMSRVAQRGYQGRGRGSVNFRFLTVHMAKNYVKDQGGGWRSLRVPPGDASDFLHYYTVPDLVDAQKDPSLINLCRRYDPRSKFVLSVSIMADIEDCPETPPPESETEYRPNQQSSWYQRGVGGQPYASPGGRPAPLTDTELSWMTETRKPHHANGGTKDDIYSYQPQSQHFSRGDQHRHTVAAPQRPRQSPRDGNGYWSGTSPPRPALLIGPEDADETEV